MINNLESYNKARLIELVKTQIEEYQKLEKERDALDNQLHELYHAMELISKIATVVPRDTAILEVINCYRTGELLQAHNLEQQAKGMKSILDMQHSYLQTDEGQFAFYDYGIESEMNTLIEQAKQLREGGEVI